jgi:hypothetical protein
MNGTRLTRSRRSAETSNFKKNFNRRQLRGLKRRLQVLLMTLLMTARARMTATPIRKETLKANFLMWMRPIRERGP